LKEKSLRVKPLEQTVNNPLV